MCELPEISEKERERRRKISEYRKKVIAKKRKKGLKAYNKRRKKEKLKKERERQKEKLRLKKEKEKAKHKKRVGRPKKRGPKKKRVRKKKTTIKKGGKQKLPPITHKIISCKNGKQNKLIGKYRDAASAYLKFDELKEKDKDVVFPMAFTGSHVLENSIDEYILIEKCDNESSVLRNEYGKLIEHYTNQKGWVIIDKFKYRKEETFWIWGLDKKSERKTCSWIYQNMVYDRVLPISVNFILTYKNKLLIRYDNGELGLVICKTSSDCITLYNILESKSKKDKLKQFIFIGDFSKISKTRRKIENELMELTGWNLKKIQMQHTTFYRAQKKG